MTRRLLPDGAHLIPAQATCVFRGEIFDVYQWPQKMYDGSTATFEMLRRPDTVVVIAIDGDGRLLVNDEEQPNGIVRNGSLPMGRVDQEDVSVLAAAQRELREETGWEFANWRQLDVVQPEAKIEWFVHLFIAKEPIHRAAPQLDAGEKIITKTIDLAEFDWCQLARRFPRIASEVWDDENDMPTRRLIAKAISNIEAMEE